MAARVLLGAGVLAAMTLRLPRTPLLALVAPVRIGTSGAQTLIHGFVANPFPTPGPRGEHRLARGLRAAWGVAAR